MEAFIDKKGRKIDIGIDDLDIVSAHEGSVIGSIQFTETDYEKMESQIELSGMNVEEEYRHAGIAFEMMKVAADCHGPDFNRPPLTAVGGHNVASEDYYTEEGAGFISYCISKGILSPDSDSDYSPEDSEGIEQRP